MTDLSEYRIRPKYLIVHNPSFADSLSTISKETLKKYNFLAVTNKEKVDKEFKNFKALLEKLGVKPLELTDVLSMSQKEFAATTKNPNLMFTRDPAITLPWAGKVFIKCRSSLPSRQYEPTIMARALTNLGLKCIATFDHDEYIEGGDVIPVFHNNRRILIVGFGKRTTQSAALKLAKRLIPGYVDEILGLRHDSGVLHLDTGLTVLNDHTILAAHGIFGQGFIISKDLNLRWINPIVYANNLGFDVIAVSKNEAVKKERCNMLPLGDSRFVSFKLDHETKKQIIKLTDSHIYEVEGKELAKAAGGVHCLSRPVY